MADLPSDRRTFLKHAVAGGLSLPALSDLAAARPEEPRAEQVAATPASRPVRTAASPYSGEHLDRVAFPIGGLGAGMFCLEGTGAISHLSLRHRPDVFSQPCAFAAVSLKGRPHAAKILEGPVPRWKKFGQPRATDGGPWGSANGLPRFAGVDCSARFPFMTIRLTDADVPLAVSLTGWSPFIPADADESGLPVGALEYTLTNAGDRAEDGVFSYHARHQIAADGDERAIRPFRNGFILSAAGTGEAPEKEGHWAIFTDADNTSVDHCWFRGGWFDSLTMVWNTVSRAEVRSTPPLEKKVTEPASLNPPGASVYVPFRLAPGESRRIRVLTAWYVPRSTLRYGLKPDPGAPPPETYRPWYSSRFASVEAVATYWRENIDRLERRSRAFADAFFESDLPPEVVEAVAANLSILKSPTVLRQHDGRMWAWEGTGDARGLGHGSCTHVWNYAQAVAHLFPALERSLRETEFHESQNAVGHQDFRASLPTGPTAHEFHAATDGQLGGIMKVYRDWRIGGDDAWLKRLFPKVRSSLDYCIRTWDPRRTGLLEEPQHNTYDIEFWGPNGMLASFYLGALAAFVKMGEFLGEDVSAYRQLYARGRQRMERELFDGEYFIHTVVWSGLDAPDPREVQSMFTVYSDEALPILQREGPKYQYGTGCLSDGVVGAWLARVCGLDDPVDAQMTRSHLRAVHAHNFRADLSDHANPQRATYALGAEGGLLLCSWPKGGMPSLPFVYSNEVWTGIEYHVASHLIFMGEVDKGLEIVRACRARYDGRVRNPFSEYEYGAWYARALASYALLQALTGVRFDAVERTLYIDSRVGDFRAFLSTATGFGQVGLERGQPWLKVADGAIPVEKVVVSGKLAVLERR